VFFLFFTTLHPGKKPAAALYYSRQIVLQNYEFENGEEDGKTEKIKTLFQSSSLQASQAVTNCQSMICVYSQQTNRLSK
jgi:hypothetical protein